jgi:hypothetical protein
MNTTMQAERTINTTILNYPGFQGLPKGIKQMLLVSELYFFDQPASHHHEQNKAVCEVTSRSDPKVFWSRPFANLGNRALTPI